MSKKNQVPVGHFLLEKEKSNFKIKVTHESDHFGFRIFVPDMEQRFKAWTDKEFEEAYNLIFSSIQLFANFSLTNAMYFSSWMAWHNDYFDKMRKEVSEQEHADALEEVKADFDMTEEIGSNGDNLTYETARNNAE